MEKTESPTEKTPGGSNSELTFGKYLKKIRLEKGFSIEDIMDDTRISKYVLQQIEEENFENLPEDVYLKGFIKSYAEAMGQNPGVVIDKYRKAKGMDEGHSGTVKKESHRSSGSGLPYGLILGVVVVVLILVLAILYTQGKTNTKPTEPETPVVTTQPEDMAPVEPGTPVIEEPAPPEEADDGLHLEVLCVEETTLKITIDGGLPEEYMLKPEDHLELKAEKMYTIMINNTCGVTMLLNNSPVSVSGKCGQTATLQLP